MQHRRFLERLLRVEVQRQKAGIRRDYCFVEPAPFQQHAQPLAEEGHSFGTNRFDSFHSDGCASYRIDIAGFHAEILAIHSGPRT